MYDLKVSVLIFSPRIVLDTVSASAPPFAAASAAGLARRARDVELDRVDARHAHVARHIREILDLFRSDTAHERRLELLVFGELNVKEVLEALRRQADRIDHPALHFRYARRRIA